MEKIKVFTAFSGIGTQEMALKRLNKDYPSFDFEVVGISEIDKFAIQSYKAIHGEVNNFGDISLIDPTTLPDMDLFTYSFPCQDLSISGKQKGLVEGTRSGLLYECEKIIEAKRPKYLLLENVKNLISKKFKGDFDKWLEYLESLGYTNYWKVLNAKDYNVAQNRERVFVVSILEDNKEYSFPEAKELESKFIDILEPSVEDKYFLSEKANERIARHGNKIVNNDNPEVSCCIHAGYYKMGGRDQQYVKTYNFPNKIELTTSIGDILEPNVESKYYMDRPFTLLDATSANADNNRIIIKGRIDNINFNQTSAILDTNGICPTLNTMQGGNQQPKILTEEARIRRLTPLECWRLMGISDEDFYKAKEAGTSNSQLYKQAGNAIVVDVLYYIFKELFISSDM